MICRQNTRGLFCTVHSVPTMPVQTFRDLAPDCPLATCGAVAAALWLERVAEWRSRCDARGAVGADALLSFKRLGTCARTTSEPLRGVRRSPRLTNIDRMIVEEDLD